MQAIELPDQSDCVTTLLICTKIEKKSKAGALRLVCVSKTPFNILSGQHC